MAKKRLNASERQARRKEHPWHTRAAVVKKAEGEQLAGLREAERTHEAVTGSNRRGGAREAADLRRRRYSSTI